MSITAQTRQFITEPSSHGGIDLFRRSPRGFVLVDTFDSNASIQSYIADLRAQRRKVSASGERRRTQTRPAML